jgi:hypothetical protein
LATACNQGSDRDRSRRVANHPRQSTRRIIGGLKAIKHLLPLPTQQLAHHDISCAAEFGRYRGIGDAGHANALKVYRFTA